MLHFTERGSGPPLPEARQNGTGAAIHGRRATEAPIAQNAIRHPAIPERAAVSPRDDLLVAATGAQGAHGALSRGGDLRGRGPTRDRAAAAHRGPRGRA